MKIDIPGLTRLDLSHVFIDYNGTIAHAGQLIPQVIEKLIDLSKLYTIHILSADTYGTVRQLLEPYPVDVILSYTAIDKSKIIQSFGSENCITIGNGSIDHKMLKEAALGIAVIEEEGCSTKAILNADIVVNSIHDALSILEHPKQLIATLKE